MHLKKRSKETKKELFCFYMDVKRHITDKKSHISKKQDQSPYPIYALH